MTKRNCLKILVILGLALLAICIFNHSTVNAKVQTDEIGDGSNTGIVVNGITMVENGEVVEKIDNLEYDKSSNTLTLNNFVGNSIRIVGMGEDFKINVIGNNTVGTGNLYEFSGPMAGEGEIMYAYMTFIGDGTLNINTTLAAIGGITIDGPTINVEGALSNTGCLNMQKGKLTVKATLEYFDKAIDITEFKKSDNIEVTDNQGKKIYFVEGVLDYTVEENADGTKTYWVTEDDGSKIGYSDIPYVKNFCYTETYSQDSIVTNIVMQEKEVDNSSKEDKQLAEIIMKKYDHYLITKYVDLGEDVGSRTDYAIETLNKLVNNDNVKFIANGGGSGGAGGLTITGGGEIGLDIYVNNSRYGSVTVQSYFMYQVVVPSNVEDTDEAYINYALPKIKSFMKDYTSVENVDSLELEKITGYYYRVFLPNEENASDEIVIKKAEGTPVGDNIFVDNLDEGVTITVTEKQNATMENEIKNKGYTNILGSYELTLEGATELSNPIKVTFNLGTEYNGKTIYILHQKKDGSFEDFEEKVVDGKVTITVSELSPFVLAVKENNTQTETPQDEQTQDTTNEHIKDETPKTGNNDIATIVCSILSVLSAAGIAIVKKY